MFAKTVFVVALCLPFTSGSTQSSPGSTSRNSAIDVPIVLTLQKRSTVGGAADANFTPAVLFAGDVATDAHGRLYLLDRSDNVVRVYDANAKLLSKIGRRGSGPGEFVEPRQLGVTTDGAVVISDNAKRAFVRFDANGKPLPEQSLKGLGILQQILSVNPTSLVLSATVRDTAVILRLTGAAIERLQILPPVPTKPIPAWSACGLRGSSQEPLLSATLISGANQKFAVTNTTSTFSLALYEAGKVPVTISRNRQPDRLTAAIAREILGDS
ncbi:MAG: 6-bladed beta-propeller [Gemmatimonadaceae bacterium]